MNVMNTKIFKRENAKLAVARFSTGHQKVVTYRTISKVVMVTISIAAVALLFASNLIAAWAFLPPTPLGPTYLECVGHRGGPGVILGVLDIVLVLQEIICTRDVASY